MSPPKDLRLQNAEDDLRWLMSEPRFQRFLLRLLHGAGFFGMVSPDPGAVGVHNFAARIVEDVVRVAPGWFGKVVTLWMEEVEIRTRVAASTPPGEDD